MRNKILALGREDLTFWLHNALHIEGIDVVRLGTLPDSLNLLKQEGFDMAVVDAGMPDVENICFRVAWLCRLRVAVLVNDQQLDKQALSYLGANSFISRSTPPGDLAQDIQIISTRGPQEFDNVRVLVIEDDNHIREAVRLSFRVFWPEAELNFAAEGQTGINIIKNKPIDIVLLDLGLPDISGFDVLARIRNFSRAPIIMLTAARDQDNVVKSIKAGANDYMVKPFKQIELMPRIRKLVFQYAQSK